MVVVPLRDSADAWDLVRGAPCPSHDAFSILAAHNIAPSTAAASAGPVLIFAAAADPDALAAVRTLTALLKSDLVRYEIHPVAGYGDFRDKFLLLVAGDAPVSPRAVLAINCGAMVDIDAILRLSDEAHSEYVGDLRVFVMDTHRPYHLANIRSNRVVLFDDTDNFNHSALPLDIRHEDEWGNVPDDNREDDESDDNPSDMSGDDDDEDDIISNDAHDRNAHDSDSDLSGFIDDGSEAEDQPSEPRSRDSPQPANDDTEGLDPQERMRRAQRLDNRDQYLDSVEGDDVVFDESGKLEGDGASDDDEETVRKRSRRRNTANRAPGSSHRKRRRKATPRRRALTRVELEERSRLRDYYCNANIATSTACVAHAIARMLRRSSEDTLWMAIVGLTAQFVTSVVSEDLYDTQVGFCGEEVRALFPSPGGKTANGEESTARTGPEDPCDGSGAPNRISQHVEVRLDLLRHWSLYDSLLYSTYTATRLSSWRQTGRRRLLELLATLGIPLSDSKQRWCYMKLKSKRAFEDQLDRAIQRFDLGSGLHYDSFVRVLPGHRGEISASDFVHAVTALLEMDDPLGRFAGVSASTAETGNPSTHLLDRFWRAYDALDPKKVRLLEDGLEMAISAQALTADIGGDVIERRKFVPSGPFRYVFLREQQHKELLSQPLLLRRLALFLNKALARQGAKEKPFIVLAPDPGRKKWLAVAVTTSAQRNDFGHRFKKAAERNNSNVTFSGFDSSVCEIQDGHEIEFVRFLHDIM